jgi:hypothetical protein
MFNKFGKKDDDDPKKALDKASNALNKGLSGGLTKAFLGKDFVDKMNAGLDMANQAVDGQAMAAELAKTGAEAEAEVISIQDTGATVNMNPVVALGLKVTPADGKEFQTAGQLTVSRIAVPRVGDKIKIRYNKDNPTQFVIV